MTVAELNRATNALRSHLRPKVRISELARQAGCSRQYIDAVLRGQRRPSAKLLEAAADLGIPVTTDRAASAADKLGGPAATAEVDGAAW